MYRKFLHTYYYYLSFSFYKASNPSFFCYSIFTHFGNSKLKKSTRRKVLPSKNVKFFLQVSVKKKRGYNMKLSSFYDNVISVISRILLCICVKGISGGKLSTCHLMYCAILYYILCMGVYAHARKLYPASFIKPWDLVIF